MIATRSGRSRRWVVCGSFLREFESHPRLISLIRRWLKARVLEDEEIHPNEKGTPQGGSISVLLSNVYLHYVLDLWFERVVKPRLQGEAYLVRYIDDFVMCFQYRADALRVQEALCKRLGKFSLTLEPTKTKLVEFGRFAHRHAGKHGRKRPETIYFLGFTLYCTCNQKGNFRIGMRTERSRLRRTLMRLQDLMRRMRHLPVGSKWTTSMSYSEVTTRTLASPEISARCKRCIGPWSVTGTRCFAVGAGRVTLDGRSSIRSGRSLRCCDQSCISHTGSCRLSLRCKSTSEERGAGNLHATFRGSRRRVTASGHPVVSGDRHPYRDLHAPPHPASAVPGPGRGQKGVLLASEIRDQPRRSRCLEGPCSDNSSRPCKARRSRPDLADP